MWSWEIASCRSKNSIYLSFTRTKKTGPYSMAFVPGLGMKCKKGISRLKRLLEFEFVSGTYQIATGYTFQNELHTFLKLVVGIASRSFERPRGV